MKSWRNGALAAALVAFVSAGAAFPFFLSTSQKPVDTSKPLSGQASVRGAYTNTGSKDVGQDPEYRPGRYPDGLRNSAVPLRDGLTVRMKANPSKKPLRVEARFTSSREIEAKNTFMEAIGKAAGGAVAGLLATNLLLGSCQPAAAVLNSPNASIARTTDAALRRAIPATNPEMKAVQRELEDIAFKLRIPQRKPWQQMTNDIVRATKIVYDENKALAGVPKEKDAEARQLLDDIRQGLVKINGAIDAKDADKVSFRTAYTLQNVASLELIQAPGLAFSLPSQYLSLPRLTGRATVEVTVERSGDAGAFVDRGGGGGKPQAQITLDIDGYSAPLTAGNFAANVSAGAYDGATLSIGGETISVTSSRLAGKVLPMEILPLGEFEPVYKAPLDVQNGELPVLPLSIYGAIAMAHPENDSSDGLAAANEFFVYKFDKGSSGLAGLSFEEGMFPVFGYVTGGLEIVPQLQAGDRISSAKLVAGADRLVLPEGNPSAKAESTSEELS